MPRCNQYNRDQGLARLRDDANPRKTFSFYRYTKIDNPSALRDRLFSTWNELHVLGRVYIAPEGINAQISVPESCLEKFEIALSEITEFQNVPFKYAIEENQSFWKLTIKVKRKIVADAIDDPNFDASKIGTHLSPHDFHQAMQDPDAIVVDMRNHYESRIGYFVNAMTPNADTFREALPMVENLLKGKEDKKILLYCTGGIRCEKASAYLRYHGFKNVSQLFGGIINYVHEMKRKKLPSKFIGKNFVFDDRLSEKVTQDILGRCDQCEDSCDRYVNCKNMMCNLLFLQCESCEKSWLGTCSETCKAFILLPQEKQKQLRKGVRHNFQRYKRQIRPQNPVAILSNAIR